MNRIFDIQLTEITNLVQDELNRFEQAFQEQFQSRHAFLQPILDYLCWEKGKRVRPLLFFLSQGLIDRPSSEKVHLAVMLELTHMASLIHDDVIDRSTQRRGKKTLNSIWGNQISVLLGDYFFSKVLSLAVGEGHQDVLRTISSAVVEMGRGELRQAIDADRSQLSVESYLTIIEEKTASLFGAACVLGGLTVTASPSQVQKLDRIGRRFGMAYQIRDDMLDFSGESKKTGKPVNQDLLNGKISAPLVFALEQCPDEKSNVYNKIKDGSESACEWLMGFIQETGGSEKARLKMQDITQEALDQLETFEESPYRTALEKLMLFDMERVA